MCNQRQETILNLILIWFSTVLWVKISTKTIFKTKPYNDLTFFTMCSHPSSLTDTFPSDAVTALSITAVTLVPAAHAIGPLGAVWWTQHNVVRGHPKLNDQSDSQTSLGQVSRGHQPGVGVTKVPFVNFSISKIFDLAEVPIRFFESHSYLTAMWPSLQLSCGDTCQI